MHLDSKRARVIRLPPSEGQVGIMQTGAGAVSPGCRWDDSRLRLRPWPLPPLRPKRAASGVAGLRYGSGQRNTNHALMSETSAGRPRPKAIPLNI